MRSWKISKTNCEPTNPNLPGNQIVIESPKTKFPTSPPSVGAGKQKDCVFSKVDPFVTGRDNNSAE
jgi:hypothetical protein